MIALIDRLRNSTLMLLALVGLLVLSLGIGTTFASLRDAHAASESAKLVVNGDYAPYAGYSTAKMYVDNTLVYCATPSKQTPPSGTYAKSNLYVTYESSQEDTVISWLAKVVYYGYGGPGFDASMWPTTWYDGSRMTTNNYIALTHIMIADIFSGEGTVAMYGCNQNFKDWVYDKIFKWDEHDKVDKNNTESKILAAPLPEGFASSCFVLKTGSSSQCVIGYAPSGTLDLQKESALPSLSHDNDCYSLAGAQYGIFPSQNDARNNTNRAGLLKTNSSGYAKAENLAPGTYYVKEIKASPGYALDSTIYTVNVKGGSATRVNASSVKEVPQSNPVLRLAGKHDADRSYNTQNNKPQGDATLQGAHFTVRYYDGYYSSAQDALASGKATRTWVFASDSQGLIPYKASALISGDALYTSSAKEACLPLGTYLIEETKAPVGYERTTSVATCQVTSEGTKEAVATYTAPAIGNKVVRGGVALTKCDSQTGSTPQGDAAFDGITFEIVNKSAASVVVDGKEYQPNTVVTTITTNKSGYAATKNDALPYGTYLLREKATNDSMLNTAPEQTVVITEQNKLYSVSFDDDVVRGGVTVTKVDHESHLITPLGAGILDGTTFEITNRSKHPILVDDILYQPGAVVATITSSEGVAHTSRTALPYGHYGLQEVHTEEGYLLSDPHIYEFDITQHNTLVTIAKNGIIENQIKRGDLEFIKARAGDAQRLAHVPFKITSNTTKESHLLVTDDNGYASTASSWNAHTFHTNTNDAADHDSYDNEAGIWFGLTSEGWTTTPNNDTGALPYDTYTIEELPCQANQGLALITLKNIVVSKDDVTVNLGTIDNHNLNEPFISTTARDASDGDKHLLASPQTAISDHVAYTGLIAGEHYTMKAWLVDERGNTIQDSETSQAFTPRSSSGSLDMDLVSNLVSYQGSKVVVFEECLLNNNVVAEHKELTNSEQTLYLKPYTLGTRAYDTTNKTKHITADPASSLTDSLSYAGFPANTALTIQGQVMIKTVDEGGTITAKPLISNNAPVVNSTKFTTTKEGKGSVDLTYTFDSTNLAAGTELVVYESVYYTDKNNEPIRIAYEQDVANTAQTVTIDTVTFGTQARDSLDDDQSVISDASCSWKDTIHYQHATVGKEYTAKAQAVWSDSGEAVTIGDTELCASVTFTPETPDGSITVPFNNIDTTTLASAHITLVEQLYRGDTLIAEERNLDNPDQQLIFLTPTLATSAHDSIDNDKILCASTSSSLSDTVAYQNLDLDSDAHYRMAGLVMNAQTHMPLVVGDPSAVSTDELKTFTNELCTALGIESISGSSDQTTLNTSPQVLDLEALQHILDKHASLVEHLALTIQPFNPPTNSGTAEVLFDKLDTTRLGNTTTVVFEALIKNDHLVASHLDYTDPEQQITIASPHLGTKLTDEVDHDHYLLASSTSTVIDTVSYTNLVPGTTYTLTGILMDKNTGEPFLVNNAEVTASKTFEAQHANGSIDISFTFDSTSLADNSHLVAFEYLFCDATLLSEHTDINDEEQTITMGPSPTTKETERALYGKTGVTLAALVIGGFVTLLVGLYAAYRLRRHATRTRILNRPW